MSKFLFGVAILLAVLALADAALGARGEATILFAFAIVLSGIACIIRNAMTKRCDQCCTRVHRDAIRCYRCNHIVGREIRLANAQH